MNDAIVVTKGERVNIVGSEIFIAVHCQECGERIIDPDLANVAFSRGEQPEDKLSFKVVCLECDRHRHMLSTTSWQKLHEFSEVLADSAGMKAQRKA